MPGLVHAPEAPGVRLFSQNVVLFCEVNLQADLSIAPFLGTHLKLRRDRE